MKKDAGQKAKFDLAPLEHIEPSSLIPPEGPIQPLDELMLAFAVFFNDLKGLFLLADMLEKYAPGDRKELTGDFGQYHGVRIQLGKLIPSVIFEFLELVDQRQGVLASDKFRSYLDSRCTLKAAWSDVLAIATEKKGGKRRRSDLANALSKIRNRGSAFHYTDTKSLVSGYRRFFFRSVAAEENEHAFVSLGKTTEKTRFYFADAAVQETVQRLAGDNPETFNNALRSTMHQVLVLVGNVLDEHCRPAQERSGAN